MMTRIKFFICAGFIIFSGFFLNTLTNAKTSEQSLDRIIVTVNDLPIMQSELDQATANAKKQMSSTNTPFPSAQTLRKQVLDQLINRKLQLQLAEQAGINVSDADVDRTVARIAKENQVSSAELYQKISSEGLSRSDYRKEMHDEMILQQIQQQEIGSKISITPDDVRNFTNSKIWQTSSAAKEYHLEDILIALPETPAPQDIATAKKRADALVANLQHGMSFKSAAAAESGDNKAFDGGDLGWRKLPEIPSAFVSHIMQAKQNDIIGPVQAPNGFHVIHVAGIRGEKSAAPSKQQIQQLLYQRKFEEALQRWATKLRGEALINMHPENG